MTGKALILTLELTCLEMKQDKGPISVNRPTCNHQQVISMFIQDSIETNYTIQECK